MDSIKIECYLSNDCGSEDELRHNIEEALRLEGITSEIRISRIDTAVARALGFQGSPTVLVNGRDIAPAPASMQGFG